MFLPQKYESEIIQEIENTVNIRSNISCMEEINNWFLEFGKLNFIILIESIIPVFRFLMANVLYARTYAFAIWNTGMIVPMSSAIFMQEQMGLLHWSAVYWAEFGYRVVYIQISQMTSLPIPLDGAKPPSVHALNRITFLTLSRWQDLVKYTCSIHETSPNVPRVILVSDLHKYYENEDNDQSIRLAHKLCACLCDAVSYCSRVYNSTSYLTISTRETELETQKLSSMFFPSTTWINSVDDDHIVFCKKLFPHQQRSCKLKFKKLNNKLRCDSVELLYM